MGGLSVAIASTNFTPLTAATLASADSPGVAILPESEGQRAPTLTSGDLELNLKQHPASLEIKPDAIADHEYE